MRVFFMTLSIGSSCLLVRPVFYPAPTTLSTEGQEKIFEVLKRDRQPVRAGEPGRGRLLAARNIGTPPAQHYRCSSQQARQSPMEDRVPRADGGADQCVSDGEISSHPAKHASTEPHDPTEAIHKARQQSAAANHDRNGKSDAKKHECKVTVRGGGHG